MYYYKIEGQLCCSLDGSLPYEKTEAPKEVTSLVYLFDREPGSCRASHGDRPAVCRDLPGNTGTATR